MKHKSRQKSEQQAKQARLLYEPAERENFGHPWGFHQVGACNERLCLVTALDRGNFNFT